MITLNNTTLFNGCSFTYGEGLDNPREECFSAFFDAENIAIPGSSNKLIWRNTKDYLFDEKGKDIESVYIVWSDINRTEFIDTTNNYQDRRPYKEWKLKTQVSPSRIDSAPWRYKKEAWNYFYGDIWSKQEAVFETLHFTLDLQRTCKLLGKKFYYTFFHRNTLMAILMATNRHRAITQAALEFNEMFNYYDRQLDFKFRQFEPNKIKFLSDYIERFGTCDDMGHPSKEAHNEYAKYLQFLHGG